MSLLDERRVIDLKFVIFIKKGFAPSTSSPNWFKLTTIQLNRNCGMPKLPPSWTSNQSSGVIYHTVSSHRDLLVMSGFCLVRKKQFRMQCKIMVSKRSTAFVFTLCTRGKVTHLCLRREVKRKLQMYNGLIEGSLTCKFSFFFFFSLSLSLLLISPIHFHAMKAHPPIHASRPSD